MFHGSLNVNGAFDMLLSPQGYEMFPDSKTALGYDKPLLSP